MWKFVARGIRETLERRACRTNVYSQTSQDGSAKSEVKTSLTCNHKLLAPSFSAYNNGFCGSAKTGGAKDKDHESKWNPRHRWSEAVSWSSILAVGWVVCQTLCLHRRIFDKEKNDNLKGKISQIPEAGASCLFGQVLKLQPKHVLPVTNCVGSSNNKYTHESTEVEWRAQKPFGPITIEEALKEASDEFASTHKIVMGEYELHYGIKALEERRYKDAIKHFTTGAMLSSPGSMFNLGLCYELGIGTLVDQVKAAKYYKDASDQGHADAIYNLGVFHAQGRGGFSVNINRARSYFAKAAKLGQVQAQLALDLEKTYYQQQEDSHENSVNYAESSNPQNLVLKTLANYNTAINAQMHAEAIPEISHCKESLEMAKNPTEIFLDFLGLNEPSRIPVAVVPSDCSVPC